MSKKTKKVLHNLGQAHRGMTLGAVVPLTTYALAFEQARIEGVTVSAMLGDLVISYLKDQGTTLVA